MILRGFSQFNIFGTYQDFSRRLAKELAENGGVVPTGRRDALFMECYTAKLESISPLEHVVMDARTKTLSDVNASKLTAADWQGIAELCPIILPGDA
jgi:hypothetical protein